MERKSVWWIAGLGLAAVVVVLAASGLLTRWLGRGAGSPSASGDNAATEVRNRQSPNHNQPADFDPLTSAGMNPVSQTFPIPAPLPQHAPGEVPIFVTNIAFDHTGSWRPVGSQHDGINIRRTYDRNLRHLGNGEGMQPEGPPSPDISNGEYVFHCPKADAGGNPVERSGKLDRSSPAIYIAGSQDVTVKVRLQWPVGAHCIKWTRAMVSGALLPPDGANAGAMPSWPELRARDTAGNDRFVDFDPSTGISRGDELGFVDFQFTAPLPSGMWRFSDYRFVWRAWNISAPGESSPRHPGESASVEIDQSGPHTLYTLLDTPKSPWYEMTSGPDGKPAERHETEPWTTAVDFILDRCGLQGVTDLETAADRIADYLYSPTGHGVHYDHIYNSTAYAVMGNFQNFVAPSPLPPELTGADAARFCTAVGPDSSLNIEYDLGRYLRKDGTGRKPDGATQERDKNAVTCHSQAGALVCLVALAGGSADFKYMAPFGYIKPVNFCGSGLLCNNPAFERADVVHEPVVGDDDLFLTQQPGQQFPRTLYGGHGFCEVAGIGYYDCMAGPGGPVKHEPTMEGYLAKIQDRSSSGEEKMGVEWRPDPSKPPLRFDLRVAGGPSDVTRPGKVRLSLTSIR